MIIYVAAAVVAVLICFCCAVGVAGCSVNCDPARVPRSWTVTVGALSAGTGQNICHCLPCSGAACASAAGSYQLDSAGLCQTFGSFNTGETCPDGCTLPPGVPDSMIVQITVGIKKVGSNYYLFTLIGTGRCNFIQLGAEHRKDLGTVKPNCLTASGSLTVFQSAPNGDQDCDGWGSLTVSVTPNL